MAAARFNYTFETCGLDDAENRYGMWQRLVHSSLELCDKPADKVAILADYLELTREAEALEKARYEAGRVGIDCVVRAKHERLEAEIRLHREKK